MIAARVFQLNVSRGGVPKLPVREVAISTLGLAGDGHEDLVHHGGPERAVSLWSLELIQSLQSEGHPIWPGAAGENVTISGLDWATLAPGARLALGDQVIVELIEPAPPCRTIMTAFADRKYSRISQKTHPGWSRFYARVARDGALRVGSTVTVLASGLWPAV